MHVPFSSRSGHKRLGGRLLRTAMDLHRISGPNWGVGRCYTVGVYSVLDGTCIEEKCPNFSHTPLSTNNHIAMQHITNHQEVVQWPVVTMQQFH